MTSSVRTSGTGCAAELQAASATATALQEVKAPLPRITTSTAGLRSLGSSLLFDEVAGDSPGSVLLLNWYHGLHGLFLVLELRVELHDDVPAVRRSWQRSLEFRGFQSPRHELAEWSARAAH